MVRSKSKGLRKENFRSILIALVLLLTVISIGITGYILIEDFTFPEAFFMTIITISTVGFREVHPLSLGGQLFTAFLIMGSFGIFAYAVTTLTRYIVDGVFRNYLKDNKVKKQIQKLEKHVIVCGYGRNGRQTVHELRSHKVPVVIVDRSESVAEELREQTDVLYVFGDATEDDTLLDARIMHARALITALPNDSDNLFVVLTAREMNPDLTIISRASQFNSGKKLRSAGATNVIMPDKIGGQRMAKLVAQPDVVEFLDHVMLQSTNDVFIEEILCEQMSSKFVEKTIGEWGVRAVTGANIIGVKRGSGEFILNPSPDVKLSAEDMLFVLGTKEQIESLKSTLWGRSFSINLRKERK